MKTISLAAVADPDAIKTSVATSTSEAVYDDADLNGVIGVAVMRPERTISVTSSAQTGAYDPTDPIVVEGTDANGLPISEDLQLTAANGGETIVSSKAFRTVTAITVPPQADVDGSLQFGVRDVVCAANPPTKVRCAGAGALKVAFVDGSVDTIPDIAARETVEVSPHKIFGDSSTTATNLTLFF